jgi:hypothetical protein
VDDARKCENVGSGSSQTIYLMPRSGTNSGSAQFMGKTIKHTHWFISTDHWIKSIGNRLPFSE